VAAAAIRKVEKTDPGDLSPGGRALGIDRVHIFVCRPPVPPGPWPTQTRIDKPDIAVVEARRRDLRHKTSVGSDLPLPVRIEDFQHHVGVDEQEVVRFVLRQPQRLGTVMAEIPPWPFVKFSRNILQSVPDERLCAVAGTGVDDDPIVDFGPHRLQAAPDDTRLVLDDHVEADAERHGVAGNPI
jgi:hypothetical protein